MSEELLQYAQELSSNRITSVTRSTYGSKQAKIIEWFKINYAEYVNIASQPVTLRFDAIPPTVIGALLASFVLKNKPGKDGNSIPYSSSHLNGYRSALVSLYKDHKVPVPPAVDTIIKSCIRGYQNKVATYRAAGTLSSKEGVDALTYSAYR